MVTKEEKVLNDFYTFCLTTGSERRLKKVKNIIEKSKEIIGKDLTKINVNDVVKYLAFINQCQYTAWTKNDYKKIFKRFLKWYYKDLEMVEGSKVKEGFKGASKKRAFNKEKINKNTLVKPEELEKLLRTANSLKWKALITFAFESAFRPCEIFSLKWKDLNFDDSLGICRVWVLSPKTKESREIPIKDCVVHMKRWRDEFSFPNRTQNDYVFPNDNNREKHMSESGYGVMLGRLCKKAKIRHLNPYLFRHSRIFELHKKLPDKISSKFAGHSIETSVIYDHLDNEDVEESMLKEIYTTKELSQDEKTKLELEVETLKNDIEGILKIMWKLDPKDTQHLINKPTT